MYPSDLSIVTTYFAFTSLSTVGFGDYAPVSDLERIIGSFILLFGVAIFSMIMANFIDILTALQHFNEGFDDGDNLSKFFGTIKKFNKNDTIELGLKKRIEVYFDYKWEHDKNLAF